MREGLDRVVARPPPRGRSRVQIGCAGRLAPLEVGPQVGPQEGLYAVEGPPGIHPGDHRCLAFEAAEHLGGILPTRQLGGQIRREDLAHARGGQELADVGREAGEDLTHEVLGHRMLVARKGREEGGGVGRVPQGDRGEPERRGPPARQRVQCRDLVLVEVHTCGLEKLPGLVRGESPADRRESRAAGPPTAAGVGTAADPTGSPTPASTRAAGAGEAPAEHPAPPEPPARRRCRAPAGPAREGCRGPR